MKLALHWQIAIAIILAVIAGMLTSAEASVFGIRVLEMYEFVGTLFLNALKMIIVPLIFSSIVAGVASLGNGKNVGRLAWKTVLFYTLTCLLAILIGLAFVNVIEPGRENGEPVKEKLALHADTSGLTEKISDKGMGDVAQIFIRMIPTNIVMAAAEGEMLGLITFSILFGFFIIRINPQGRDALINLTNAVYETMMLMTLFVMRFVPIGVFALVAKTVSVTGFEAFVPLFWFFITVVVALLVHVFVAYPLILYTAGISPTKQIKAMMPALLMAFSSASSSATLPLTIRSVEENAGVSKEISSFVLPLGATVNMNGTALYECVAAMFIAQAYGIELGFATQLTIVLLALLTSIGVAGIPAASLVAISIILVAVGLPMEAIGLILVTDRVLDMCRTAVNVYGDTCAATVIARSEGEQTAVAKRRVVEHAPEP